MINWLIEVSLRNRFLVLAAFALLAGWGYWALLTTPIDAIPDLSDNQVIAFTDWWRERELWDDYMQAYGDAIARTATRHALAHRARRQEVGSQPRRGRGDR